MKKIAIAFLSLMIILSACESVAGGSAADIKGQGKTQDISDKDKARFHKIMERKDWSEEDKWLIYEHKLRIGFTKAQVLESWGNPYDVNRTVTAGMVSEQWRYGNYGHGNVRYVYFENGILTAIQD